MIDIKEKPSHPLVAVSILSADFGQMAVDCRDVIEKRSDLLHVDVMDGHFAPNLTMGADMLKGVRKHLPNVYLDSHLMVEKPQDYVEQFAKAGSNNFSFHWEVTSDNPERGASGVDAADLIKMIHDHGMDAGLVINPDTQAQVLEKYLGDIQVALVMSVWPGFSGQKFMPEVLEKVKWLRENGPDAMRVEMDGGVSPETVNDCAEAGCDMMVSASAVFGSNDRAGVIEALHESAKHWWWTK
ncbi:ribulose-phosphate 3-epimerase [Planctomycetota bacterium]|nr:ribulose-phosphate 3-epimerase [Planctomycetota bacterium]